MNSSAKRTSVIVAAGVVVIGVVLAVSLHHSPSGSTSGGGSGGGGNNSKLLGNTYKGLVAEYGKPSVTIQALKNGVGMFEFEKGKIVVSFVQNRVYQVSYSLGKKPLSLGQAKKLANSLMPGDATTVTTRTGLSKEPVYVYHSTFLSNNFASEWFSDAQGNLHPGYFDLSFVDNKQHQVTEIDLNVGDGM